MERQYYRKKIISAKGQPTQWLSMDNQEYDQFLSSPEAADRYFIDFGNCILEASYEQYAKWRREQDHHNYLKNKKAISQLYPCTATQFAKQVQEKT